MHKPRKRFGQHFLKDPAVIQQIIAAIMPQSHEHLIEIGPGKGALTLPLLKIHPTLTAIEIDRDLIRLLSARNALLTLIEADVLKFDFSRLPSPMRIIGNLPYNISTPLLFYLLKYKLLIKDMIFMLQKEVVERLCAKVNTKNYGRLTVMLQREFEIDFLFDVSPDAFDPPPNVMSAIVRLQPKKLEENSSLFLPPYAYQWFEKIVLICFQHRRQTLRRSLKRLNIDWQSVKIENYCDLNDRPENLSVSVYVELARQFAQAVEITGRH